MPRKSSVTLIDELSIDHEYSRKEEGKKTLAFLVEYAAWMLSPAWLPHSHAELANPCPLFCGYLIRVLEETAKNVNFDIAAFKLRRALTAFWDMWRSIMRMQKAWRATLRRRRAAETQITAAYMVEAKYKLFVEGVETTKCREERNANTATA